MTTEHNNLALYKTGSVVPAGGTVPNFAIGKMRRDSNVAVDLFAYIGVVARTLRAHPISTKLMVVTLLDDNSVSAAHLSATERYQKAADLGNADAQNYLGTIYDMCA
jgi:hypothetical protein